MFRHYLYRHIRLDKNEPFYIGIGTKQKRNHYSIQSEYNRAFNKNRKESYIWNNIVNKPAYEVEILLESDDYEFIKNKEIEFIKLYGRINLNTGCLANMTDGGDGILNFIRDSNWSKKVSDSRKGVKQKRETIEKRIKSRKGYKHSQETKEKMANSHKGKKIDIEHLKKLRAGQIKANSKSIDQYDMNNNFIKTWESATVAGKELNIISSCIRNCVRGITKHSGGFIWKPSQISYR